MTRYKVKATGAYFLFFNSHWKHGYGKQQADTVAYAISENRKKYGFPPTVLAGDFNQFCKGYELEAYKYLTGQSGSSPVKFFSVHEDDWGRSFGSGGDCRVDFILATVGQWSVVEAEIDRDGMGEGGTASDHAALSAELVPLAESCCTQCAGFSFCSPGSRRCYNSKNSDYYESCPKVAVLTQ